MDERTSHADLGPLTCSVPDCLSFLSLLSSLFSLFSSLFSPLHISSLSTPATLESPLADKLIPPSRPPYIACHCCCPYRYPGGFAAYFLLVRYRTEPGLIIITKLRIIISAIFLLVVPASTR